MEFPRKASNLLEEHLRNPDIDDEKLVNDLKFLVPRETTNIFDAAARSLIVAFERDVARSENKRYVVDGWEKQFRSLADWGERDAYEVRLTHLTDRLKGMTEGKTGFLD